MIHTIELEKEFKGCCVVYDAEFQVIPGDPGDYMTAPTSDSIELLETKATEVHGSTHIIKRGMMPDWFYFVDDILEKHVSADDIEEKCLEAASNGTY